MKKRSHLQHELPSVPAMVELLETRRIPSEVSMVHVDISSSVNRITPVVQLDPSGNPTVNQQTYAEDVSLFGVFAQNGVGYVPGDEFQFDVGTTSYDFFRRMPTDDEGSWFWI